MGLEKGLFVVLTGIDGAGKDYVAKKLHELDPGSALLQTPTEPFIQNRFSFDRTARNWPEVHYAYYLASVVHASALARERLKIGNVYCVRYLLDTIVYHRAMGLEVEIGYETPPFRILRPNLTVFLRVDERVRQERLNLRTKSDGDLLVDNERFRSRLLDEYEKQSTDYVAVNNSDRDVAEVVSEIQSQMRSGEQRSKNLATEVHGS